MKVGDVIKVNECMTLSGKRPIKDCGCLLCAQNSNRIGVITGKHLVKNTLDAFYWSVSLDVGPWNLYQSDVDAGDVEVISESR